MANIILNDSLIMWDQFRMNYIVDRDIIRTSSGVLRFNTNTSARKVVRGRLTASTSEGRRYLRAVVEAAAYNNDSIEFTLPPEAYQYSGTLTTDNLQVQPSVGAGSNTINIGTAPVTTDNNSENTSADAYYWQSWNYNASTNTLTLTTNRTDVTIDTPPGSVTIEVEGVIAGLQFNGANAVGTGIDVTPTAAQRTAILAAGASAEITAINNPGKIRATGDTTLRITAFAGTLQVNEYTAGQPALATEVPFGSYISFGNNPRTYTVRDYHATATTIGGQTFNAGDVIIHPFLGEQLTSGTDVVLREIKFRGHITNQISESIIQANNDFLRIPLIIEETLG